VPGAQPFAIACLFTVLWLAGATAESAAVAVPAKIAWYNFQALWQLPTVTAMTCFALEYAGRRLTRRNVILLSIPPLLALLLLLTNDLHHLAWLGFTYDGSVEPLRGMGNWILLVYGWSLVLVNISVFLWLFIRSPQLRWPVALMIFGQIAGRGLYLLEVANLDSVTPLDPYILAILFPFTMYAIALFGFRIFDPLPAARRTVIDQMREGMVVFDTRWQVLSLNPAAEGILSTSAARACRKTCQQILPAFPDLCARLAEAGANPLEIRLGTGPEARNYTLTLSPLRDHRGLIIGYLLLLRDVTERRRAQAQVLAQQWAEATLQERELLADELHDGLSQSLAFLNVQAQAAQLYLQTEQREAAQTSLARLAEVARDLQGDMRELIGNLLTVSLPAESFCATLRQVLTRFEEQNGLAVSLEIDGDADALCGPPLLPPAAGVQLLRIVQEALANVRKHAGRPSQISVRLGVQAKQMLLAIADNGAGFDPALPAAEGKHFGLRVMHQRAARIGGQVAVHSIPGQGTRVEVWVPLQR
jgi:signal transduction histidine kinase